MILRQAVAEEVIEICEIEKLCFSDPWSLESMRYELEKNPAAIYIVAEDEGRIAGYAGLWWITDEGHITNVAVRPEYRGRGIASEIIRTLLEFTEEEGIRDFTLEVRESNIPARNLYEKYGFTVEGVRKGYYRDNKENALIMWRRAAERNERR